MFTLCLGPKAMFYLAAAVSDFYIPASDMPEHKIQSSNGPLQVRLVIQPFVTVCILPNFGHANTFPSLPSRSV